MSDKRDGYGWHSRILHPAAQPPFFHEDSKVTLIDFEWAGKYTTAEFPDNVNVAAFGEHAKPFVLPGILPPDFDWLCLADIFKDLGNDQMVAAAIQCDIEGNTKVAERKQAAPEQADG